MAAGMTSYTAVFEVEAFQAWGELDTACFQEEPENLSSRLDQLPEQLYTRGKDSQARAKRENDKQANSSGLKFGD